MNGIQRYCKEHFKSIAAITAGLALIQWAGAGYAIYLGEVGMWWSCALFGVIGTVAFFYWITVVKRDLEEAE